MPTIANSNAATKTEIRTVVRAFNVNDAVGNPAIKQCPVGSQPPWDTVTTVLHGQAAFLANKVWYFPFIFPFSATLDLINLGFGATNTGNADTIRFGFYDAITGDFITERSLTITPGVTASWVNLDHENTTTLPEKFWLGIIPELSSDTSAEATCTYAASTTGVAVPGFTLQFAASGNPNAATMTPSGRVSSTGITRPFSWPSTMESTVVGSPTINGANEFMALRVAINAEA